MAVVMGDLYKALTKAGAGEDDARKAAEEVAALDIRLTKTETDLRGEVHTLSNRVTELAGKVTLLQRMVGFNIALTVAGFGWMARIIR